MPIGLRRKAQGQENNKEKLSTTEFFPKHKINSGIGSWAPALSRKFLPILSRLIQLYCWLQHQQIREMSEQYKKYGRSLQVKVWVLANIPAKSLHLLVPFNPSYNRIYEGTKRGTKVNETESPPPPRSQSAHMALFFREDCDKRLWESTQVLKHQLRYSSLCGFLKRFAFIILTDFTLIYMCVWGKCLSSNNETFLLYNIIFNCVSAGRNESRMIKTLVVLNDLFQDTLNFLLLIRPSIKVSWESASSGWHPF